MDIRRLIQLIHSIHKKDLRDLLELNNKLLALIIGVVLVINICVGVSSFFVIQELVSEEQDPSDDIRYNINQSQDGATVKIVNFAENTKNIKIMVGDIKYKEISEPDSEVKLNLARGAEVTLIEVKENGSENVIIEFTILEAVNGSNFV